MARLSTQPKPPKPASTRTAVALRSAFVALPSGKKDWVFARIHGQQDDDEEEAGGAAKGKQLFITNLPVGCTEKSLKKGLAELGKVAAVELLPSSSSSTTLLAKEIASTTIPNISILPLFTPEATSSSSSITASSVSAIISFASPPSFPPSSTLTLPHLAASLPSFLTTSASRYSLSRPHPSTIIAHTDTWTSAYDARKLAAAPPSYTPASTKTLSKTAAKKLARAAKNKDVGPLPGSAAAALAAHAEYLKERDDRSKNPDEIQEGEWTLVSRGGKHGKSLLPTGATATVEGYGGVTVGVARRGWKGVKKGQEGEEVGAQRKIVGDGFYRFTKEEGRKKDLAKLKERFEEDKRRLGKFREGGASRGGRGRGRGAGAAGGREGRSFKPY
ncbi:hypothetical protein MNV49_001677 [Pseudohyphozyma bogoriensis]|nr:hypothetical protein MNV49_001677 [Pseudohyphozyma bogoriensis]